MNHTLAELTRERAVLLDGGLGTQLIARGLEAGRSPELWNVERPDDVRAVHATYFAAGSDVVHSNSFGGNPFVLERHGLASRMEELSQAAARIARAAAGTDRLVAGDLGPSGRMLKPLGDADPEELTEGFARQAAALAAGGADYLAIETMIDLAEARCALRGARRTGLDVTVTLTFDRKKRGFFTIMGDRPADCARALAEDGAAAIGANCSISSDVMLELASELLEASPIPVILQPNAGKPEVTPQGPVYRQRPSDFARDVAEMVRRGARLVGGCCGTDARFIAALRAELDALAKG